MPAGLDEDDRRVGFEAGVEVIAVPVPEAFAVSLALRLGAALDGVVDDDQLPAKTRDARPDPDRLDPAAEGRFPL